MVDGKKAAAADRREEEPTPTSMLYAKFRVVICKSKYSDREY